MISGRATQIAAEALSQKLLDFAAAHYRWGRADCRLRGSVLECPGKTISLIELSEQAAQTGVELSASGSATGLPRSVAFNVHGFRVAVDPNTGFMKILRNVQAADAGTVVNPMQCRGQVEGAVTQALGAALFEEVVIDDRGRVTTPTFRTYHLPSFGDVPPCEVFFAETYDALGPFGAKSMSESPYNPVMAALGNAIRDAVGVRLARMPFRADNIFAAIAQTQPLTGRDRTA